MPEDAAPQECNQECRQSISVFVLPLSAEEVVDERIGKVCGEREGRMAGVGEVTVGECYHLAGMTRLEVWGKTVVEKLKVSSPLSPTQLYL